MKKIGFLFSSAPHGNASGREGLDAVLATSNYTDDITLFFVGDGVMQLIDGQRPEQILCRDYIATFKMLFLCDVEDIYICEQSLVERGVGDMPLIIDAKRVAIKEMSTQLNLCEKLLQF